MTTVPSSLQRHRLAIAIAYGVACHLLFTLAVAGMIVAMYFGMTLSLGRLPAGWAAIANAVLLAQFPLAHSLLLFPNGMAALKRLSRPIAVGGSMVTTTYVIVASVQVILLFVLWTPTGTVWWRADGAWLVLLTGLYTVSWLLLLKAIYDAGFALQTGLLGWWAVACDRKPAYPPMPVTGLFRFVRQPIYVAFALTTWTVPTWTPDQLVIAIVLTGYCVAGPLLKEQRFRQRYGHAFAGYAAAVPYWLPWPRARSARVRNDLAIYDTTEDWWAGTAPWMRSLKNLVPARFRYFDTVVADWQGLAVLDLGCGAGFMSEPLAERGARVTGIDPSPTAIAIARRHAAANGRSAAFHVARGESLPFSDGAFDVVVCVDVLEHVVDSRVVLAEVRRVLRPGGLFLFDTINRNLIASLVMVTLGERILRLIPRGTHDPAKFVTPSELRRMLEDAGLDAQRFVGMGPVRLGFRREVRFALVPTTLVQYVGHAVARGP